MSAHADRGFTQAATVPAPADESAPAAGAATPGAQTAKARQAFEAVAS